MRARRKIKLSFVALCLAFFLGLLGLGWQIDRNRDLARQGKEAHDALCVFKAGLRRDVLGTRVFLKKNPKGIPGIPVELIRANLHDQEGDLKALQSKLKCSEEEAKL